MPSYVPHAKQVAAHRAFLIDGYKRGVLLMGRQCFVGNTLVATPDGYTHIKDLQVGDRVLSSDGYKKIINTWKYDVDTDPKPIVQFKIDEETITCTYDHKFYYNGQYVPVYQLIWGAMAASERLQLELLCQQYGKDFDYKAIRRIQDGGDETGFRQVGLSSYHNGQKDSQGTPNSSADMATESREKTRGQSHRCQQGEQQYNQSGVGYSQGEYTTHTQNGQSSKQAGRELWDAQAQRTSGITDTSTQRHNELPSDSRQIQSIILHDSGHHATENLVSSVTVHTTVTTYAIDVEDTHDYCITTKNVLVGNSGKTYFATNHGWLSAVINQGRYFVVFKTYKQAHEVVWRQYVPLIPKEIIYKKNEQDLLIEFHYVNGPVKMPDGTVIQVQHDESKPRSTLQLLGSDQADSHRGFRANGIIFDEYADQDPGNWDAVYKHFFTTTDGWAIFMGTPRGYNHFYDQIEYAKVHDMEWYRETLKEWKSNGGVAEERPGYPWFYQKATWRDSPYVKKEMIMAERAEADAKGTLSTFLQEVELEFRQVQGAVYPQFNRDKHIVKPNEIPPLEELTLYAGIDFGYHTTACIFVGIDRDQNWWIFDEVYGKQEMLIDVMPRIWHKLGDQRLTLMVGDSAAKDAIETMLLKGFPIVPVTKKGASNVPGGSIAHGIDLIRAKLKNRTQFLGPPKPSMFISTTCKNFIKEMEAYKYPEEKKDRNPSELPQKEDDHGPDALRYLMLHLKYGVNNNKTNKIPPPPKMNEYGLPVF